MSASHRDSIFLEEATVIHQHDFPAEQFVLRVAAPEAASRATAGSFAHIRCDPDIPMRRPLSIMRADAAEGWVEFLYKIVGEGLRALSEKAPGEQVSILAPIGRGFGNRSERPVKLMLGGGVGIPPMVFLAEQLREMYADSLQALVLMGSEVPFPFEPKASTERIPGIPAETSACMPLLESQGIRSRLASLAGFDGCHHGFVTDLAREWLGIMGAAEHDQLEVFACGPEAMLEAVAALADEFDLPCELCLEEYMACGVGGCAGCAVEVMTPDGPYMKRVCVDGPVFAAKEIYWK